MKRAFSVYVGLISISVVFSGCGVTSKFKETKSINYTPFADHTVALLSTLNYDINPNEVYLMRPYIDFNNPDLKALQESVAIERKFLKGIMSYSLEVVNLSESGMTPVQQVAAYKEYVAVLAEAAFSKEISGVSMSKEKLDGILAVIGKKPSLLEAMQAARPLVIEFNQLNIRLVSDIAQHRDAVLTLVRKNIDDSFADFVKYDERLRQEKKQVINQKDVRTEQLAAIQKKQELIDRDLNIYHDLRRKLDQLGELHDEMIRAGGRAVLIWISAHQQMAAGKTNSAEWFGASDLRGLVSGSASKVIP